VIAPPVGGDSPVRIRHVLRLAAFAASLVVASTVSGVLWALCGHAVVFFVGLRVLAVPSIAFGTIALTVDTLKNRRQCGTVFSSHWQVPRRWAAYGSPLYEVAFGAILGVGFLTVVPFACFYLLVLLIACTGSVAMGAGAMAAFGVARCLPLVLISTATRREDTTTVTRRVSDAFTGAWASAFRWTISALAVRELFLMAWN
jgi:hypothetical protein